MPPLEPLPLPDRSSEEPASEFVDGAPLGHPATRPQEAECFIQRDLATDSAETALHLALIAQPSGFTVGCSTSEVLLAVMAASGVAADDVRVKKFYPEQFIILCSSPTIKNRVRAASPIPLNDTPLVLLPWTRLAHANLSTLQYKLTVELEGVPPHVWHEDTAAKLLAPYYWIQSIEPITAAADDLSSFRLTAWTNKPSSLPQILWLNVVEHEVRLAETGGVRFRGTQPFLWKKDTMRYRIIVHLRCVHDYSPQPDYRGDGSSSDDPAEDGRNSRHHHGHRDSSTEIYPFPCRRGEPDGNAPGTSGGDGQDRNRDR
ncbi:unnamed protein product [Miscanthus lutarioriparius]|uniref:DUF4283 domain-containing protein n=1 Tax=Miscanthus lutarioriparius TaxID=422564 RepID=A0A811Q7W5_9POAL|nr:unnamed protein product [Miscanthus lutarioriparius]